MASTRRRPRTSEVRGARAECKKEERMSQVSFAADIKPLFRAIDISHMERYGIRLDDYTYISNQKNANSVPTTLSPHDGRRMDTNRRRDACCDRRRTLLAQVTRHSKRRSKRS